MNIFAQPKSEMIQNVLIPNIQKEHVDVIDNIPVVNYPKIPDRIIQVIHNVFINKKLPTSNDWVTFILILLFFIFIHGFLSGLSNELFKKK